jgi:hypothetical protein
MLLQCIFGGDQGDTEAKFHRRQRLAKISQSLALRVEFFFVRAFAYHCCRAPLRPSDSDFGQLAAHDRGDSPTLGWLI